MFNFWFWTFRIYYVAWQEDVTDRQSMTLRSNLVEKITFSYAKRILKLFLHGSDDADIL